MNTSDDKEYYLPTCNLSSTDDEKNNETEYLIDPEKQLSTVAAKIETDIISPISEILIVVTTNPFFKC